MKDDNRHNKFCRACHGPIVSVLNLGVQPPSNAFVKRASDFQPTHPLGVAVCQHCYLMQLDYDVSPLELFGDYVYFSSGSREWLRHTSEYCEMIRARLGLDAHSQILEIGSNDGHLLKNFIGMGLHNVQGLDPSYSVAQVANAQGVKTEVGFFNSETIAPKADLVIANNVLAHVPDLNGFVYGLARTLKPTGTVTVEFPHALNLIKGGQFDTIYHEHYSYLSLRALEPMLGYHGLSVYDVEKLSTHGGSLRLYIGKYGRHGESQAVRDVRYEESPLASMSTYAGFAIGAQVCRDEFKTFLKTHTVVGYGAAAKGNTFLNYCGLTAADIKYVADVTPAKQDKLLPGSLIPVFSEEALIAQKPPYVLILPWNWECEIMERLAVIRQWGGRFVIAVPQLRVF